MNFFSNKANKDDKYEPFLIAVKATIGIGVLTLILFIIFMSWSHKLSTEFDPEITQTVWGFIGSVIPIFISIVTVILIFITFQSNQDEFKALNSANKKIIEANNFQQFNTTFESLIQKFENIIDKIDNDEMSKAYESFKSRIYKPILIKQREKDEPWSVSYGGQRVLCYDIQFQDNELDEEIIKECMQFKISGKSVLTFQAYITVLIFLIEYLEKSFYGHVSNRESLKFYLFRIFDLIKDEVSQNFLLINSIGDKKLRSLLLRNRLLKYCNTEIDLEYYLRTYGIGANIEAIRMIYNFPIYQYFIEGRFNEINTKDEKTN
jgi:hypothetical protein